MYVENIPIIIHYINYIFHCSFPQNEELAKVWHNAIPIELKTFKSKYLCSKHFAEKDIIRKFGNTTRTRIRKTAIPTIFDHPNYCSKRKIYHQYVI